ncbi:MAG: zinc-binding alcohol dehydrogenase [Ruminococcaceae bacterium]|nr:zinc-binding alcohol dehydrogenase [Oscillospiraceae bacterium]
MQNKQILFTSINTAELVEQPTTEPSAGQVLVKTAISTISCGTERANLTGGTNVSGVSPTFPRYPGYSSAGTVESVGEGVTHVKPGDRVVVYWGVHAAYNLVPAKQVVKIGYDNIAFPEAAFSFIATFPLAAIRKCRVELGESAMVMGCGLLGQLAIRLLRAAGVCPIIAADLTASRREEALQSGADYAFDPSEKEFAGEVKKLTGGGVNVCIEVTGVGAGLDSALDCMARFGRVALLGCTRDKNFCIDYYHKVHFPGIQLLGAHTAARPDVESHPGYYTHEDDIRAVLRLCALGRLKLADMIREQHDPADCREVYTRLAEDRNFPIVTQFIWERG